MNESLFPYLKNILKDQFDAFIKSTGEPPSLRVNSLKNSRDGFIDFAKKIRLGIKPHPLNPLGFILPEEHNLSHTLEFFRGEFLFQGLSSQIPPLVLDPQPGELVADIAAAPGSKSTQIAAMMENKGRLILIDSAKTRLQSLFTNINRAGVMNEIVIHTQGQRVGRLFYEQCDRVLVDAPCSAMSALPAQNFNSMSFADSVIQNLSNTQYSLLVSGIKATKPGGRIVYSTCTLPIEENEKIIDAVCEKYPVKIKEIIEIPVDEFHPGFTEFDGHLLDHSLSNTRRVLPGKTPYEAFYIAKLEKTGELKHKWGQKMFKEVESLPFDDDLVFPLLEKVYNRWGFDIDLFSGYKFYVTNKKLWIVNNEWEKAPADYLMAMGLAFARRKSGKVILTNAGLHLLNSPVTKHSVELNKGQVVELFLNHKLLVTGFKNGYYVAQFEGENLGVVSIMSGVMKIRLHHHYRLSI